MFEKLNITITQIYKFFDDCKWKNLAMHIGEAALYDKLRFLCNKGASGCGY